MEATSALSSALSNNLDELFTSDRLEDAHDKLADFLQYCHQQFYPWLTGQQARLAELQRETNAGTLTTSEMNVQRNRIRLAFQEELNNFRQRQLTPYFGFANRDQLFDSISSRDTVIHEILTHRLLPKRYRLELPCLIEGNSAIIYRVENLDTTRHAIVLVIKAPTLDDRVREEIKRLTDLRHRNVIKILDHNLEKFPFFILSEFVYGPTLPKALESTMERPLAQATDWLYQLAEALDYLRHKRILHTNVRPSKIYVDEEWQLMISPVDLFKVSSNEHTFNRYRDVCQYGSPELLANDGNALCYPGKKLNDPNGIDLRAMCVSDQYSIGLVGYKILTGRDLFAGNSIVDILESRKKFKENQAYRRKKLGELPASKLSDIIVRLLSETPEGRYPDLHGLIRALHYITRSDKPYASAVRQSYRRCLGLNREMIRDFYRFFHERSTNKHRGDFSPIGEKQQYVMLQMAVDVLIDIDTRSKELETIVQRTQHANYSVPAFELFLDTLLYTIEQNDPQWDSVKADWQAVRDKSMAVIRGVKGA